MSNHPRGKRRSGKVQSEGDSPFFKLADHLTVADPDALPSWLTAEEIQRLDDEHRLLRSPAVWIIANDWGPDLTVVDEIPESSRRIFIREAEDTLRHGPVLRMSDYSTTEPTDQQSGQART